MRTTGPARTALITGASSGIGEAFACVCAAEGFNVVLVARRKDRLDALASRLRDKHPGIHAHVIVSDLSRRDAVAQICSELERTGIVIDFLINNAGYGVTGVFTSATWATHDAMLQVMVITVAELTHRLLPGMMERGYGRIIHVASLAGLVPAPAGHTLYAATKAFAIKFAESLSGEVRSAGVHVTALCPGFTLSEFHDVTGTRAQVGTLPRWMWMDAPTVARQGYDAVMAGVPVYVNGRVNRSIAMLVRYLPLRLIARVGRIVASKNRNT